MSKNNNLTIESECYPCGRRTIHKVKKVEGDPNEPLTYEWTCLSCIKRGIPYYMAGYWTRGFVPKEGEVYV